MLYKAKLECGHVIDVRDTATATWCPFCGGIVTVDEPVPGCQAKPSERTPPDGIRGRGHRAVVRHHAPRRRWRRSAGAFDGQ